MAKTPSLEDTLAALNQLRAAPGAPESVAAIRKALTSPTSHVVAKAAEIVGEAELTDPGVVSDLVAAFDRFMVKPGQTDKGCRAKAAIAEALYRIGYDREGVFLQGIRHVQREPVWGGTADTAPPLRAACALGLVRMNYTDAMLELADLLADKEAAGRTAAARAIAYSGDERGVPLLRFKALCGDDDMQVLAECFTALLKLAPRSSVPFVAGFLDREETAVAEAAAVSLGGSRLNDAFDPLRGWCERTVDADLRRTGLLAVAMLRHDRSVEYLLGVIAEGPSGAARDAVAAMSLYRDDPGVRGRVEKAAAPRAELRDALREAFGASS